MERKLMIPTYKLCTSTHSSSLFNEILFPCKAVFCFVLIALFRRELLSYPQRTPLHNAATEGHLCVVKYLVKKRAQVDSKDSEDV